MSHTANKQTARDLPAAKYTRRFSSFAGVCLSFALLAAALLAATAASAQVNVLTRSYDNARTGSNLEETILTPTNVNPTSFGKLFTIPTDGQIYAQPLYMSGLSIGGGTHNVVFVASMLNTVYAIDADTGTTLWSRNFGTSITSREVESDQNISWNTGIGILGTPVIDPTTDYMYFATGNETHVDGNPVYSYNLNAIDVHTGDPVLGSPVAITGTYSTPDLTNPIVFVPKMQNQRPALALANGNVYVAFASHEDQQPYHGWVMAYSASNLSQVAVYSDTTTGVEGGIWNAGGAPTIDTNGNLYISTGNGSFGTTPNNLVQTGNSFIKLSPTLELLDYFTPYNSNAMNSGDQDLGASGLLLIPNTNYLLGGGKQGVFYLVDSTDMTHFNSSSDKVRQEFQAVYGKGSSHIHGSPIYFDSAVNGPTTYVWGENDYLRAFSFSPTTGLLNTTPLAMSTMTAPVTNNDAAMPGGFMTVTGNTGHNGIVWASTPYAGNAVHMPVQGVLYAFNATTLAPLWSDKDNDTRDEIGMFAKYVPPVIANGKLYMATFGPLNNPNGTGALVVYGLLPTASVTLSPASLAFPATTVGSTSAAQTVKLSNTGSAVLNISSIALSGANASSYVISQQTCGTTVAGNSSCTFAVAFKPTTTGSLPAAVAFADNAAGSPQQISITASGTGTTGPAATLLPATLTFPSTAVGSTSAYQMLTLSNTGNAVLNITSIAPSGAAASSYGLRLQTCGSTLAAGATCTFYVAFRPNTTGSLPVQIRAYDNATGSPQIVNATGTGLGVTTVTLTPPSLTFPTTTVGKSSPAQQVKVSNTGATPLAISSIAPSGTNASAFALSQQTCGTSLAAGASCTFSVTFTPATVGSLPGTIAVTDDGSGSPQSVTLSATGAATGGSGATLSPTTLTFPSLAVGSISAYQEITLANTGSAVLDISSIALSGSAASSYGIREQTCGATLATGATCTFYIVFRPNTTGPLPVLVRVNDNAANSPQTVSVTGTGH